MVKIYLDWLNLSLSAFKINIKEKFLNNIWMKTDPKIDLDLVFKWFEIFWDLKVIYRRFFSRSRIYGSLVTPSK